MKKISLVAVLTVLFTTATWAQTKVVVIPMEGETKMLTPEPSIPGYILGRSAATSNGRFTHNMRNGFVAATEMCRDTFTDEPTAHLCSHAEIQNALATDQFDATNTAGIHNVNTWTYSVADTAGAQFSGTLQNSCWNFTYNSGDVARGTRLVIELDTTSPGNGGGVVGNFYNITANVACGTNYPVMCCR